MRVKDNSLYNTWAQMKQRCLNSKHPSYRLYGGRGIMVCGRWRKSFSAFLKDMGACPRGMSLDRINNDGNYEPGNCRWATASRQRRNSRTMPLITFRGRTLCPSDWADEIGIKAKVICDRLEYGWSVEQALLTPAGKQSPRWITFNGKTMRAADWARKAGITRAAMLERLSKWPVAKAITLSSRQGRPLMLRSHCKRGHALTGDNLYLRSDGVRRCRICTRVAWRLQKMTQRMPA